MIAFLTGLLETVVAARQSPAKANGLRVTVVDGSIAPPVFARGVFFVDAAGPEERVDVLGVLGAPTVRSAADEDFTPKLYVCCVFYCVNFLVNLW